MEPEKCTVIFADARLQRDTECMWKVTFFAMIVLMNRP